MKHVQQRCDGTRKRRPRSVPARLATVIGAPALIQQESDHRHRLLRARRERPRRGAGEQRGRDLESERLGGLELDNKFELVDLFDRQVTGFGAASEFMAMHPQLGVKNKRSSLHRQQTKPTTSPGALQRSIDRLPSPFPNHFFWW